MSKWVNLNYQINTLSKWVNLNYQINTLSKWVNLNYQINTLSKWVNLNYQINTLSKWVNLYISETIPTSFTHRLSDTSGREGEDIELYVELSKPGVEVSWLKDRKPLLPSERIKILCERYRQVLRILDAIPEDEGEYTCLLPDNTETSATVSIKGRFTLYSIGYF